jgi:hypothetical protein
VEKEEEDGGRRKMRPNANTKIPPPPPNTTIIASVPYLNALISTVFSPGVMLSTSATPPQLMGTL